MTSLAVWTERRSESRSEMRARTQARERKETADQSLIKRRERWEEGGREEGERTMRAYHSKETETKGRGSIFLSKRMNKGIE